jgi:hypothetical protein
MFPRNRKISENHGIRGQFMWLFLLLSFFRTEKSTVLAVLQVKKVIDPLLTTATGVSK